MLASPPVRASVERRATSGAAVAVAAGVASFAALFFARGTTLSALVWIGGVAVLLAACAGAAALLGLVPAPSLDPAGAVLLGALFALAAWVGLTTIWSISPEDSWQYTNRTLVYAAFALLGALAAAGLRRPAESIARGAALLLALLLGWALLAKCVPALYSDYGRIARLRAPLDYWNELALLAAVAVPVALWLASRRYVAGALLLYGAGTTVLLTYSRFGLVLALLAAVAWILLAENRVESLAAAALAAIASGAVFGIALALPGITKDAQPHAVRVHDGWIFALVVVAGGAAVAVAASLLARRWPVAGDARRRIERVAAIVGVAAAVVVVIGAIVFAGRIWHSFANPVSSQISSSTAHLGELQLEQPLALVAGGLACVRPSPGRRHGGGDVPDHRRDAAPEPLITTEPHNVPLQFLSETGIVGFLILLVAIASAGVGVARARGRARRPTGARGRHGARDRRLRLPRAPRRRRRLGLRRHLRADVLRRRGARRARRVAAGGARAGRSSRRRPCCSRSPASIRSRRRGSRSARSRARRHSRR